MLVEDMGAVINGEFEKLGEFPVMDGDETGQDQLEAALSWLREHQLMTKSSHWGHSVAPTAAGGERLTIRVIRDNAHTEYLFKVEKEPHPKRFHLIGVYVFIPKQDDAA
jgi:hypothetical protein